MADKEAHIRALGLLTINFAFLEMVADFLLMGFVSPEQRAAQITVADSTLNWVLDKLAAFAEIVVDDDACAEAVRSWIGEANGVRAERNRFVHGALTSVDEDFPTANIITFTICGKRPLDPTISMIPADPAAIEKLARRTRDIGSRGLQEVGGLLAKTPAAHWHGDYR